MSWLLQEINYFGNNLSNDPVILFYRTINRTFIGDKLLYYLTQNFQ